jgi:hypothetical protein
MRAEGFAQRLEFVASPPDLEEGDDAPANDVTEHESSARPHDSGALGDDRAPVAHEVGRFQRPHAVERFARQQIVHAVSDLERHQVRDAGDDRPLAGRIDPDLGGGDAQHPHPEPRGEPAGLGAGAAPDVEHRLTLAEVRGRDHPLGQFGGRSLQRFGVGPEHAVAQFLAEHLLPGDGDTIVESCRVEVGLDHLPTPCPFRHRVAVQPEGRGAARAGRSASADSRTPRPLRGLSRRGEWGGITKIDDPG